MLLITDIHLSPQSTVCTEHDERTKILVSVLLKGEVNFLPPWKEIKTREHRWTNQMRDILICKRQDYYQGQNAAIWALLKKKEKITCVCVPFIDCRAVFTKSHSHPQKRDGTEQKTVGVWEEEENMETGSARPLTSVAPPGAAAKNRVWNDGGFQVNRQ